jgi:thiol-disulfide isomerase/thioredoxin
MAPNYLQVDDPAGSNYMLIVWQWGENLQITARWDQFQKSFSIERPSEINRALLDLRDISQEAYQTYLAGKDWELEDGSQLLEKEDAILQYQKQLIAFANSTPYLMPTLVAMRWVSPVSNYEHVPEFLVDLSNKWKKTEPDHPWVTALYQESNPSNLPVLVGAVFPNLKLPMISRDTLSLNDLLGKRLTIIDLWASWCAPCRKENRDVLIPLWDKYHDQGLQIIAIGLESDPSSWRDAVERDGTSGWFQASHVLGDEEPLFKLMRVQTIPANFILDSHGVVLAKNVHGSALIDWVKDFLKGNK